jgi:DnaJ-class molecular chaperone
MNDVVIEADKQPCQMCNGEGKMLLVAFRDGEYKMPEGTEVTCPECSGSGEEPDEKRPLRSI